MRLLPALLACSLLTACSSLSDLTGLFDSSEDPTPMTELTPIEAEIQIHTLWKKSVGDGYSEFNSSLRPALLNNRLFIADQDGLIEALDAKTGESLWDVDTDLSLSAGPGLGDGLVVAGTHNGEVIALSLEDGSTRWTSQVPSEILATPRIADGIVVIRTIDGKITGLDQQSGEPLWVYERSVPALSIRGTGSPAIASGWVIDGYASGKLVALQLKDGKLIWESSVITPRGRSELDRLIDLDTDPIVLDGIIYVAGYQGGISAVSLQEGDIIWQRQEMSSTAGLAMDMRDFYLTDTSSRIWALVQRNGAALWKQDALLYRKLTAPALHQGHVVVADVEGYVHWLSTLDGHVVARIRIDDEAIEAPPLVEDDVLYVYSQSGVLAALSTNPIDPSVDE